MVIKDELVQIKMTKKQKEQLQREADEKEISLAEYCRQKLFKNRR